MGGQDYHHQLGVTFLLDFVGCLAYCTGFTSLFLIQVVRVISTWVLIRSGSPLSIGGGREYY